jgi:hypothetical protein
VSHIFLSGAETEPTLLRSHYPDARFVARAAIPTGSPVAAAFQNDVNGEVWGILIETASATGETVTATADDGRTFAASLPALPLLDGDPNDVLATARYWELPPAFVGQLKTALSAVDEDPSDGN